MLDGPVRRMPALEIPTAWREHPGCRDAAVRYGYPFDITTPGPFPGVLVAAEARSRVVPPPRDYRFSVRDCDVVPRFVFMTPRDRLFLHLDSRRQHLPHIAYTGQVIDHVMIPGQPDQERRFDQPGNYPINIRDLPQWVGAMVYVLPNHFIDTTDLRGHFRIERVPVGNVTVNAWYPGTVSSRGVVAVRAGETASIELRIRQAPPPSPSANPTVAPNGRPYDSTQAPQ